jgi:hypothetical protein
MFELRDRTFSFEETDLHVESVEPLQRMINECHGFKFTPDYVQRLRIRIKSVIQFVAVVYSNIKKKENEIRRKHEEAASILQSIQQSQPETAVMKPTPAPCSEPITAPVESNPTTSCSAATAAAPVISDPATTVPGQAPIPKKPKRPLLNGFVFPPLIERAIRTYSSRVTSYEKEGMADANFDGTYAHHQLSTVLRFIIFLIEHCGLNEYSTFVDGGAGLNGPAAFASILSGCRSFGFEYCAMRAEKTFRLIEEWIRKNPDLDEDIKCSATSFLFQDITKLGESGTAITHYYSWDSAMNESDRENVWYMILYSEIIFAIVYREPPDWLHEVAQDAGWTIREVHKVTMKTSVSGQQHTAIVYKKERIHPTQLSTRKQPSKVRDLVFV